MAEPEQEPTSSGAGQRLGAPETLGISTLDPTHRPPAMPPGRHVTVRVRMLDDTEELFDVSVSLACFSRFLIFLFSVAEQHFLFPSWLRETSSGLAWQLKVACMDEIEGILLD